MKSKFWVISFICFLLCIHTLNGKTINVIGSRESVSIVQKKLNRSFQKIQITSQIEFGDKTFFQIEIPSSENDSAWLNEIKGVDPNIIIEPNQTLSLDAACQYNDPLLEQQWYYSYINAGYIPEYVPDTSSRTIIVGVIDSGIDFLHEDLQNVFWINHAEDINNNGKLDSLDLDGIDQDNNGYVDDVIGYDFVDTPELPSVGDYLDEDPFPDDEFPPYGHGTGVAGIIAAEMNNNLGIAGIARNVKIMNLRAGNASGILETDDVVKAIFYAVENGAQILNMSFGDRYSSRILKAAIDFAISNGVIVVASAGNDNSSDFHYPAAYPDVIAVAALDQSGQKASFSNYGSWIDCTAPGRGILTTTIRSEYHEMSGTSFSAPIISAVLSQKLLLTPEFTPSEIISSFQSHLTDIPPAGFDSWNGHGLPLFPNVLQNGHEWVSIISPPTGATIRSADLPIIGTVMGSSIYSYSMWLYRDTQLIWNSGEINSFVFNDTLAVIPENVLNEGKCKLVVQIKRFDQTVTDYVFPFEVMESQSGNLSVTAELVLVDSKPQILYQLHTGSITTVQVDFLDADNQVIHFASDMVEDSIHFIYTDGFDFKNMKIHLYDARDNERDTLISRDDVQYITTITSLSGIPTFLNGNSYLFPDPLIIFPRIFNPDTDLSFELIASNRSIQYRMEIVEFPNFPVLNSHKVQQYSKISLLPYGIGDMNHDGREDILAGFAGKCYIIDGQNLDSGDSLLMNFAFVDSLDCWPVRIDSSTGDIFVRKNNVYQLWAFDTNWQKIIQKTFVLDSNTVFSTPKILSGYFTQTNVKEYAIPDFNGKIFLFREAGEPEIFPFDTILTGMQNILSYSLVLDTDGNGLEEIFTLVKTDFTEGSDIRAGDIFTDLYRIAFNPSETNFSVEKIIRFKTKPDELPLSNGIVADPDGKGILINTGNNAYRIQFEQNGIAVKFIIPDSYQPWPFIDTYLGNKYLVGMMNGQSFINLFNDANVSVVPELELVQDTDSTVSLMWQNVSISPDSAYLLLYRDSTLMDSVDISGMPEGNKTYFVGKSEGDTFSVKLIIPQNEQRLVAKADSIIMHTLIPPLVNSPDQDGLIRISHPFGFDPDGINLSDFVLVKSGATPGYVLFNKDKHELFLSFPRERFSEISDTLFIAHLKDKLGGLLAGAYPVEWDMPGHASIYPAKAILTGDTISVFFNYPLKLSLKDTTYFQTSPAAQIVDLVSDQIIPGKVNLLLKNRNVLFRGEKPPFLIVYPFIVDSVLIAEGQTLYLPILLNPAEKELVEIFPNPLYANQYNKLHITGVNAGETISVLTITGKVLWTGETGLISGGFTLDLNDKKLVNLKTGVYIIAVRRGSDVLLKKWFYIK